jgi:hypothetical protein
MIRLQEKERIARLRGKAMQEASRITLAHQHSATWCVLYVDAVFPWLFRALLSIQRRPPQGQVGLCLLVRGVAGY